MLIHSCIHTYICARLRAGVVETGCDRGMEGTAQKTIAIKETIKKWKFGKFFHGIYKQQQQYRDMRSTYRVQSKKFRLALRRKWFEDQCIWGSVTAKSMGRSMWQGLCGGHLLSSTGLCPGRLFVYYQPSFSLCKICLLLFLSYVIFTSKLDFREDVKFLPEIFAF